AQTAPYDIEIGIRIVTVDGNRDMYRTQTDETSGVLLRSFSLLTPGPDGAKFFDRLRIDASDLGAGPAGSLRIEADKAGAYRFRLGYRHMNMFSALPAFANPLLGSGITTSQHTYDRTRNMVDADLELFPDSSVMPFIGYSFNRLSGPGTSSYTLGGDEFRLSQSLEESEHEFRVGAGFHLGLLRGSVTHGWRSVRGNESLSLASSSGGNNPDPLLGLPVSANTIRREDHTRVSTPFTNLYLTGQLAKRLRLTGNYIRSAADSTGDGFENTNGSFVSFALSRFFNGLAEQVSSQAKNTTWRGGARAEVVVWKDIDAFGGYQKEHHDLEGSALIETLFLQTLTFGGVDLRDVEKVLNARSSITRGEEVVNAGVSARALGPFSFRIELREAKQNVIVSPDLSEIVVPGNQGGHFGRDIRTLDSNASYTLAGFTLGGAWRHDHADQPIFRTDFRDRDRLRLRASWRAPKWVRAGATAEETKQSNAQPGIDLTGKSRQYGGDVEVTPHEGVVVRGSVARFIADNSILMRRPENFATDRSVYAENGTSYEAGGGFRRAALSFDASMARFTNRGDHPFGLDRLRFTAGCDLPPKTKMSALIEFAQDKYREQSAGYSDFDARRVGMFVRYHP
ncbi:MAG: hypothetical protein QOE68_4044, partial [Thermoanaerobaculia bacterium]|nr:hypothetical protein [Thermoanaerobaculia bacterium]